jgi:hypothetical protein
MLLKKSDIALDRCFSFEGYLFGKSHAEAQQLVEIGLTNEGATFVEQLNGHFCGYFRLHQVNRMVVFNDRLGMKDIYLYKEGNDWSLGTSFNEVADLVESPTPDEVAIRQFIRYGYPLYGRTFLKQVSLCPPGCIIEIDTLTGNLSEPKRYWQLAPEPVITDSAKALPQLVDLMDNAVRESFNEPDKRYLVANSGGLDSRCNLLFASRNKLRFSTYTYGGALKSDAMHVAASINKALRINDARYIKVETGSFLSQHAGTHMRHAPLLPMYSSWYFSPYQHLADAHVNVNGFASVFLDSFTYRDEKGRFENLWNQSFVNKAVYCSDVYQEADNQLMEVLFRKPMMNDIFDEFVTGLNSFNTNDLGQLCDAFDLEHRQRCLNKQEPWNDFYGKMEERSPLTHNSIIDFSQQLSFELRHQRKLYKDAMAAVAGPLAKVRFERTPFGMVPDAPIIAKLKNLAWRADMKLYKKAGYSFWFKGTHKNVAAWMLMDENIRFIRTELFTSNPLFEQLFDVSYIRENHEHLIRQNFVVFSAVLTIFLFLKDLAGGRRFVNDVL